MAGFSSIGRAVSFSVAQLIGLLSVLSQFFGAINALRLNWISIAPDLIRSAAGLSTQISIGGFLIGWHTGSVLREGRQMHRVGKLLIRAVVAMAVSYLGYWALNAIYTADNPSKPIDVSLRLAFLAFYALPFGFLSYSFGLLSGVEGDRRQNHLSH